MPRSKIIFVSSFYCLPLPFLPVPGKPSTAAPAIKKSMPPGVNYPLPKQMALAALSAIPKHWA
jgi:hypothetical protein